MSPSFYGRYHGEQFDKAQPIRGEHYDFYHELAFDFLLFTPDDQFRVLDLGCGTANFLIHILQTFPESTALTYDFSSEMVEYAARKTQAWKDEFKQRNLHDGIPDEIGSFDLVTSFSTIHHPPPEVQGKTANVRSDPRPFESQWLVLSSRRHGHPFR
ncbi:TPA: hypothetical protein DCE37_13400 [Candidatus Latescibacteria bacterium]|mgnify:CR=1 FL=1|nr:hypothetical protein [Candidatus Latescibacterota bacterium]